MKIVIAPNAFKNSLNAEEAAKAIEQGLKESFLNPNCFLFPIADGGDGTAEFIIKKLNGVKRKVKVKDALGRNILADYGLIHDGKTAVIGLSSASGINLLRKEELNPMIATTFGTGQLMKDALDLGVKKMIVGVGGSATVDGGMGILQALGIIFKDEKGQVLTYPKDLVRLSSIDSTNIHHGVKDCEIMVLCDVNNPLLGPDGAATIFGPQKGATPNDIKILEEALTQFANVSLTTTGKNFSSLKHSGAAGGSSAGMYAFLNAKLVNGIDYFLDLTGFEEILPDTDLIITAEGSIDDQTLLGKGPFGVAIRAKEYGIPIIGLAGQVPLNPSQDLQSFFSVLLAIGNTPSTLSDAIANTEKNLKRTSNQLGNLLSITQAFHK